MFSMRVAVGASIVVVAIAAYPTTFPFENESYKPPDIPASTPNETLDPETDTGGYIYSGPITMSYFDNNLTNEDLPYCPHLNGYSRYLLTNTYGAPPVLPEQTWNCSSEVFDDVDFTGQIGTQTICDVGNCCKQYIPLPKYSSDQMEWHTYTENRLSSALCPDMDEELYCLSVGGHFQSNCFQYYPTVDTRIVVFPCYDYYARFTLDCKVFQSAYTWLLITEPPMYMDQLNIEQSIATDVIIFLQDRLCHPYSYYYPSNEDTSGEVAPSIVEGASSSSSSSMWNLFVVALCCVSLSL